MVSINFSIYKIKGKKKLTIHLESRTSLTILSIYLQVIQNKIIIIPPFKIISNSLNLKLTQINLNNNKNSIFKIKKMMI